MNLSRIEYFLAAAEHLNFTRAANALYITQPSLSKQIALLEDELGGPLFIRNPRDLQLTPAGKLLSHELSKIMPEIDAITEKVKRIINEKCEVLCIGCVETVFLGEKATNIVSEFASNEPDIELFIERHGFDALHNKITNGTIDAAFTFSTQIGKMKDIVNVEIDQRLRHVIVSKKHRLASFDKVGVEDIRNETFAL